MSLNMDGVEKSIYRVFDFKGGLNTNYTNTALQDNEATDLMNVDFTSRGAIKQRAGLVTYGTTTMDGMLLAIHPYQSGYIAQRHYGASLDSTFLDILGETRIKYQTRTRIKNQDADGKPLDDTFEYSPYTKNLSAAPLCFFKFGQHIYFLNKDDGCFVFEGEKDANGYYLVYHLPTVPKGKFALVKNQRVYITGNEENPNYVYFSVVGEPENFDITIEISKDISTSTGAGGIIQTTDLDSYITGIAEYNSRLIIFKPNYVYSLTGVDSEDDRLEPLNIASGCINGYTIAKSDNQLFYLASDGVRAIRNVQETVVESIPISDKITPSIDEAKDPANINDDYDMNGLTMRAASNGSRYYLSIGNDSTFVFDEILGAWTMYKVRFLSYMIPSDKDDLYFGFKDGKVRYFDKNAKYDSFHDSEKGIDRVAIPTRYSSPVLTLGEPEITKRFRSLKVFFKPNGAGSLPLKVRVEVDYKGTDKQLDAVYENLMWDDGQWDQMSWDSVKEEVTQTVRFSGTGNTVRVTFENLEFNQELEIHGFVLIYKRKRKVR